MKQFSNINQVLNIATLESVKGTVDLNLEQLEEINNALASSPRIKLKKEIDTAKQKTAEANGLATELRAEIAAIEQRNSEMSEALNELHPIVLAQPTFAEKVKAVRALLASKLGVMGTSLEQTKETFNYKKAGFADADWELINNLPHNREADQVLTSKN